MYHNVNVGEIYILATHLSEGNAGYVYQAGEWGNATAKWKVLQSATSLAWVTSTTTVRIVEITQAGTILCAGGIAVRIF